MIFIIYSVYKFLRRVIASCLLGVLPLDVIPQVTPTVRHYTSNSHSHALHYYFNWGGVILLYTGSRSQLWRRRDTLHYSGKSVISVKFGEPEIKIV